MKAGKPKTTDAKPARQARARNNAAVVAEKPAAKPKTKTPRSRGLLAFLLADPRIAKPARDRIRQAWSDGVTPEGVAAFAMYVIEIATIGQAQGSLEYKDLLVTLTKVGSHLAAAAQLGQGGGPGGASISVTFAGTGPSSTHLEIGERRPPDPEIGDLIETE